MIVKEFNAGWGDDVPLRQFEKSLCDRYLHQIYNDSSITVMLNSTWYTDEYHQVVLKELEKIQPDRIIMVAMLDPANPKPHWYDCKETWALGYYPGQHHIDAWALIVDRHFHAQPSMDAAAIDLPFICLNRKPRWHRRRLYQALTKHDLLDKGIVTLGGKDGQSVRNLDRDVLEGSSLGPNPGTQVYGIYNDIMTLGPPDLWNRCLLNVVTETVFDIKKDYFVSEKIYKPVVGLRPFLVYAAEGGLSWLKQVGIEPYINDFRDISDVNASQPYEIPKLLTALAAQPKTYFQHKYLALQDKILHNKSMFEEHVRRTWAHVNQGALCQT